MEGANFPALLDGLRRGDPKSWIEFDYCFHRPMLSAMARQFPSLQSSEAARDVVSTALQRIVRQVRHGAVIDPARLSGYVLTTCTREAIKEFRYRTRLLSLETCLPDCQLIYSDVSAEDYIMQERTKRSSQESDEAIASLRNANSSLASISTGNPSSN
jgi:hypothetical protein